MVTHIPYAHYASVRFEGELTMDSVVELVRCMDAMVEHYRYAEVELVVSSQGGAIAAFDAWLHALARWLERGVWLRTRVEHSASSAAALMVAVGVERSASPGAQLRFHSVAVNEAMRIDAQCASGLHETLRQTDVRMARLLAARAIGAAKTQPLVPCEAQALDLEVLAHLTGGVKRRHRRGAPEQRAGRLAHALGRRVERALRRADEDELVELFLRLFACDRPISAPLARTLRLIDTVAAASSCTVRPGAAASAPGLTVPQWRGLYPPWGEVPRELLTRHTLALGETGSGKTASAIVPVLAAMARAPRGRMGAALVIDPKRELGPVLERLAPRKLRRVSTATCVLNVMAGHRWRLDADLERGRYRSAAAKVLQRIASFVPSAPARVLGEHAAPDPTGEFFDREGMELLVCVVALLLWLIRPEAPAPEEWIGDDRQALRWLRTLAERAEGQGDAARGPNVVALAAWALHGPLVQSPHAALTGGAVPQNATAQWLFARIAQRAAAYPNLPSELHEVAERLTTYWHATARSARRQFAGVLATACASTAEFAAPGAATALYFGCEPGFARAQSAGVVVDFASETAPGAAGHFLLFQPARDRLDHLLAVALKALFFEAVLEDPARVRGGADLPLVGYVADEFHRFVTSDATHGEQSYLDTCRSHGAFCVLACQSVSSVEHALTHGAGGAARNDAAVSMLWNNAGTKMVFRTTDRETLHRLEGLCPAHPGGLPSLVRARPPASLAVGECYAALADGRLERERLDPFSLEARVASAESARCAPAREEPAVDSPPRRRAKARRRRRRARTPEAQRD